MYKAEYNRVDRDQSQEWLNVTGKKVGGIIGVTKASSALSRSALFYSMLSNIVTETEEYFAQILT